VINPQSAPEDPLSEMVTKEEELLASVEQQRQRQGTAAARDLCAYEERMVLLSDRLELARVELAEATERINSIYRTRLYRYSRHLRAFYFRNRTAKLEVEAEKTDEEVWSREPELPYALWVETYDTLTDADRSNLAHRVAQLSEPPLISVLLPVFNTPEPYLTAAIESVRGQIYPHWELCIADDCSSDPALAQRLEALAREEPRIKFTRRETNGHISAASNSALALASGSWIACLDHDDVLAETALAHFALEIARTPGLGALYSDEDKISETGERSDPFFKPDFDPLLLLGQNYLCHLTVLRRDLVLEVGGYREGYEGSQDWDLALRVTEKLAANQVSHIARVLYHWRIHSGSTASALTAKSYAAGAGTRAVADHLARCGAVAEVVPLEAWGWNRVKWSVPDPAPLVSIVIPTRDGKYLTSCIESIRRHTTYPNYEIVVVDNGSTGREVLEFLRLNESTINVVRDEGPFNFSAINNNAVALSGGDVICLLNDDTEIISPDWLEEMVGQLSRTSVGAVGAKLYYDSGLVQHAGAVLGIQGVAGHALRLSERQSVAYQGRTQLPRQFGAVTGACMVIRREAWDEAGGLDSVNLPVAFNDIDLCMKLRAAGWQVVWTPFAELTHHESVSRGPDTEGERALRFGREILYMKQRWGVALRSDSTYNPNLTLTHEDLSLAWPPRNLVIE
jgi:glycosyltransferase involved in cell wall biosynthesis